MAIDMIMFDYRDAEEEFFKDFDKGCFEIKFVKKGITEDTLKNFPQNYLDNVTVISVFITEKIDENVLKYLKNLRVITTRSTGVNHIDLEYCKSRGIAVLNVMNYGAQAVAQYTMGLIIALVRNIVAADLFMRSNTCNNKSFIGRDLNALTLGVIGTGTIGGSICQLASSFGMKVICHDIFPKSELVYRCGVEYVTLDNLLERSDVVSINVPYTVSNKDMIAKEQFEKMKKKPYIINTSRGELVNLNDLKQALKLGNIRGAALDVLSCETLMFRHNCDLNNLPDDTRKMCIDEMKIIEELKTHDNVILTPHIAYETKEAIEYILQSTMNNIRDYFKGEHNGRVV